MKRSPIVLLSTVAGVAAVLALNPDGTALSSSVTASGAAGASSGTGTTSADSSTTDTTTATPTATTSTTSSGTAATGKSGTATGAAYSARNYGNVKVKVTVKNGKITKITNVSLPQNDGRSMMISQEAGPMLIEQALSAQSANINGVSGATFTSMAFAQSLQSALDKLGV